MLVPASKLPPTPHTLSSSWALHLHNCIQSRSSRTTNVCCNFSATAASNSSFDEPNTSIAMSKGELESCQWLKPSQKASTFESLDHRLASSSSLSTSYECCFSAAGSSANGYLQSSAGSSAVHASSGFSTQPSNAPLHTSSSKHSSNLFNTLPAPSRFLDVIFPPSWIERAENGIERAIFDFRFLSLLAVIGSLAGSFLCFLKGCVFIVESYAAFYAMCIRGEHTGKMVLRLVEAVDVYLTGTVMLIFGMGLYGLFISNVATNIPPEQDRALQNSSLFGMFLLQERPKWMKIASLDELKTKLGHVVVMILLVKMFERSKAVTIVTGADLLSYSVAIFLTSGALLVLRHLHH